MSQRKEGTQPTSLWLGPETRAMLEEIASQTGMSRSAVVREAIRLMYSDSSNVEVRRLVKQLAAAVGT